MIKNIIRSVFRRLGYVPQKDLIRVKSMHRRNLDLIFKLRKRELKAAERAVDELLSNLVIARPSVDWEQRTFRIVLDLKSDLLSSVQNEKHKAFMAKKVSRIVFSEIMSGDFEADAVDKRG